ncbi:MAG: MFS transporter [Alteraurantiacibacter sp.]
MMKVRENEVAKNAPLLLAASVGIGCSAMALPFYAIGALTKPLTEAYGWSRADVQTAILLSIGAGALASPLVGRAVDRWGARVVALFGLTGVSVSFLLAASAAGSLPIFYLAFILMATLGSGSNPVSWTRGITLSFDRQLGLALGIALTGTGLCAILAPQLTTWLIGNYGVTASLVGLAAVPVALALPLALAFFRMPINKSNVQGVGPSSPEVPSSLTGFTVKQALKGYRFWLLFAAITCIYLAQAGIITNLIPSLSDRGLSAQQSANLQSVLGVSIILGRLVVGLVIDRLWAPGVAAFVTMLPVLACVILPGDYSYALVTLAVILIGVATGAELDFLSFLTARYFGLRHYATIFAVTYAAMALAAGFAPFAFAATHDHFGSYDIAFFAAALLYTLGAVLLLFMGRYPQVFEHKPRVSSGDGAAK